MLKESVFVLATSEVGPEPEDIQDVQLFHYLEILLSPDSSAHSTYNQTNEKKSSSMHT